jgi:hypothetical protein
MLLRLVGCWRRHRLTHFSFSWWHGHGIFFLGLIVRAFEITHTSQRVWAIYDDG